MLDLEKFITDERLYWEESPEHSTFRVFNCGLVDSSGISIPGFTVEIVYRVHPRFDDCKYTFTVFAFRPGGLQRAYQLEVVPADEPGHHDDAGICMGPHHHVGTKAEEIRIGNLGCLHHDKWFREFLRLANIKFGGLYIGPFDDRLFP